MLGLDFRKIVVEVHPSLHETSPGQSTNISNKTLEGLALAILKLKAEKKIQLQKVSTNCCLSRFSLFILVPILGIITVFYL